MLKSPMIRANKAAVNILRRKERISDWVKWIRIRAEA